MTIRLLGQSDLIFTYLGNGKRRVRARGLLLGKHPRCKSCVSVMCDNMYTIFRIQIIKVRVASRCILWVIELLLSGGIFYPPPIPNTLRVNKGKMEGSNLTWWNKNIVWRMLSANLNLNNIIRHITLALSLLYLSSVSPCLPLSRKREQESLIKIYQILIRVYQILICLISSQCFLPDTYIHQKSKYKFFF